MRKLFVAFILLFAIAMFVRLTVKWSEQRSWQKSLTELRDAGEPITFQEINARRPAPTNPAQTAAPVIARVAEAVYTFPGSIPKGVLGSREDSRIDFFAGIPGGAVQATRDYLAPRRIAMSDLDEIAGLEPGRYDISYDAPPMDPERPVLKTCAPILYLRRLVCIDMTLKLVDGDLEGAAATIPLQLQLLDPLAEEPTMVAHRIRARGLWKAVRTLEDVLRVGTLDEETLGEIGAQYVRFANSFTFKWALWGNRVSFIGTFNLFTQANADRMGPLGSFIASWNGERGCELLARVMDAGDDAAKLLSAQGQLKSVPSTLFNLRHTATLVLLVHLRDTITTHVQSLADTRIALIALAAERHRLGTGHLPTSLDDLAPEFLSAIPIDPFDGNEMKFTVRDEGIVIYSSGEDGIDNGGSVERGHGKNRRRDRGFRLFKILERGLVLLDDSTVDDG